MNDYPVIFGSLLLAVGSAAIACALYAARGEYGRPVYRVLFALCFSLMLWSGGLAVAAAAASEAISRIGFHIAPVGYCTMFGLLLHYVLLLTERTALLKKWWIYVLIYLPGALSLYGFSIMPLLTAQQYAIVSTPLGWVNVSMNGWVWFYYAYYGIVFLISVLLLWRRARSYDTPSIRKQAKWLLVSLIISVVLGTVTDVGMGFLGIRIPSIAPVFSFLPIFGISYSINRYGLMRPPEPDPSLLFLDRSVRPNIYRILGYAFIAGCALNLVSQRLLYSEALLPSTYIFSFILLLTGAALILTSRLKLEEDFKELLLVFVLCLLIPVVTMRFWIYGGITIWTMFFALLVVSLLLYRRILLISVLLSALLSQLLTWAATPDAIVSVDTADYIVRLGLIVLTSVLCVYVNRIYRARLRENTAHVAKQSLISRIAHNFISADKGNFDEKVSWMLAQCGACLQCDSGSLALLDRQTHRLTYSREWLAEGAPSCRELFETRIWDACPELLERLGGSKMLIFSDDRTLPQEDTHIRALLQQAGIAGTVIFPIVQSGYPIGYMSFNANRPVAQWNVDSPAFLSIIANTVGDSVAKIDDMRHIHRIAYHDQLTALPNRLLFKDRLNQAIALAQRTNNLVGVVFLDLDSFKAVNDTMGHELGDRILQEMAALISRNIRDYDTVARYGGDEFVLLLDQVASTADMKLLLDKFMDTIQTPITIEGQEFFMTGSAGVALCPQDGTDAETLIKHADLAMYQAKALGKNRYALCSSDMKDKALGQMKLTNLLYRALERRELIVYYQPQVDLETQQVVGMEALLRWALPGQGMISPAVFIPLAEQTGLINPIGDWVLYSACHQVKLWQDMGLPAVRIAVNISLHQLTNKHFPQHVSDVLKKTGLGAEYLELEVTESVANTRVTDVAELLGKLKELGVSLSIDDFGTEYSSLSRLKQLPVDRLKLDMQFVQGIETNEKDRAIAKVIISLAKSLNMKVIAEGVETARQLDFLSQKLCDEVQGYYFYKPMPAADMELILKKADRPARPSPSEEASAGKGQGI